jgi:hypothetical protein
MNVKKKIFFEGEWFFWFLDCFANARKDALLLLDVILMFTSGSKAI